MAPQIWGCCPLFLVSCGLFDFSLVPDAENSPRAFCDLPDSCFLLNLLVQRLEGCLQTSCSVSLELVYLENHFSSSKKILWYMQEESSWRWWLDSCLGKEMYVGAAAGHQSQAILFCSFWDCHSALCSELVPNIFWGFPHMKWGLQHQWWTLCSSSFCVFHSPGSDSACDLIHLTPSCLPWNV